MKTLWCVVAMVSLPLMLAGCASAEAKALPEKSAANPAPDLAAVAAATPKSEVVPPARSLTATGSSHPSAEAALAPKASGILASVLVEEGDRVKRGQTMFRLESVAASLQVEQARAALAQAKVQLHAATLEHTRATSLFDGHVISQAELDRANAARDGARAAVNQAEALLAMARKGAHDTTVTSPIDGVVTAVHAHRGETVTMMPPTVVVEVQRLNPLEIRASFPEAALRNLHEGDPVEVRFTAIGESRQARIQHIAARVDPRTRTVEVRAEVNNEDLALRSGMMVQVELVSVTRPAEPEKSESPKPEGDPS